MPSLQPIRALAAATFLLAGTAQATAVFEDWTSVNSTPGNHQLSVTAEAGRFEWTLSVTPWNAEALALFVDLGEIDMPAEVALSNLNPAAPVSLFAKDSSSSSCGAGCNLNGLALPALAGGDWELVFRLGSTGFDGIQTFSWTTSDFGLGEADVRLVAVRAQQLCSGTDTLPSANCDGSDKAFAWPSRELTRLPRFSQPPAPVPTPATGWLLLPGLLLAAAGRRLRR